MPPTVPMYSGAYVTAAFDFGVPINPGYPLWTLSGFLWSHFVLPVGNPAWRLSMMSVAAGATLVGTMALLMNRSVLWIIGALPWGKAVKPSQQRWIAATVGISTALMFGFDRLVWKWACTPEPQALYTMLYFLAVASFFSWLRQPHRRGYFYTTIALLSSTVATADMNGWQASAIMTFPFVVGVIAKGTEGRASSRAEVHSGRSAGKTD